MARLRDAHATRRAGRHEPRRLPRRAARGHRRAADGSHDRGRALPRRARRLAGRAADAVRRPGPRAVVDGHRGAAARAARRRGAGDLVRRRDRGAPARGRRERWLDDRGRPPARPRRDRGAAHGRARRLGALRRPLPRERGPRAAAAAAPAGAAHAPVDAAPALGRPAGGGQPATARSRSSSRPTARCCATSSTCRRSRELLADIRARRIRVVSVESRSASPFASSLLFDYVGSFMYEGDAPLAERRAQALALDRELLAELLGSRGAARADRPGRGRRPRARAPGAGPERARRERSTASPTCCAGSATCARRRWRHACSGLDATAALGELEAHPPRGPGADRRGGALDRGRGRRRATATRSAPARRRAWPRRSSRRSTRRSTLLLARWARTHAPFTADEPAARWGVARAVVEERLRATGGGRRRCSRAPSDPAARPTSSPIPTSCASCAAARWRGCAARSSRSSRRCSPASCPRGRGSARRPAASGASSRWWRSSRECRSPHRSSSATCFRLASPATRRACSTSWARPARSCGSAAARWAATTAGWRSSGATASTCSAAAGSADDRPSEPIHDAIRQHLQRRGASFFPQLRAAVAEARNDDELLDALWDLVWAGEVTNDTFAPLRALSLPRSRSRRSPRPGRVLALGPPRAAGRWSLVADLVGEERSPTERGHALATTLLERHGVVTREAVVAEGIAGGYASVYPVLRAMEESGRARRGYFVAGLGAAQFALPGAVDRLRAIRDDEPTERLLAATDPAQPYGAALAVAARLRRRAAPAPARRRRVRRHRRRPRGALPRARRAQPASPAGGGGRRRASSARSRRCRRWSRPVDRCASCASSGSTASRWPSRTWPRR